MVIVDICKFFHRLIKFFFCSKLIQIGTFIFQSVKVSLHWCIVTGASCFAHALCHMDRFAKSNKCLRCILRTLVTVQNEPTLNYRLRIQGFLQCTDCKATGNMAAGNAGCNTPVMQVYNGAIISYLIIIKKQTGKVCTPFFIYFICHKILV